MFSRRQYVPPSIPYAMFTIVVLSHTLKVTIQKFRNLKVFQTPVKTGFYLWIVISIFIVAPRLIHKSSIVRILMMQSPSFITSTGLAKHRHNHSALIPPVERKLNEDKEASHWYYLSLWISPNCTHSKEKSNNNKAGNDND